MQEKTELTLSDVLKKARAADIKVIDDKGKPRPVTEKSILAFKSSVTGLSLVTADGQRHLIEG